MPLLARLPVSWQTRDMTLLKRTMDDGGAGPLGGTSWE
jgi:hypothetical protein